MPSGKVVLGACPIQERQGRLRELEIILRAKNSGARIRDRDEWSEINGAENANEAHVRLVAGGGGAILHGHEDSRISSDGGIVDDCTSRVVEGLDGEVCEAAPMLIEASFPVEDESINDGGAIELRTKCVEDETCVHRERFQSCTSYLKCVSALIDRHGGFNLGVHGGRVSADLNHHQVPRDEHQFAKSRRGWRSGHGQKRGEVKTWVMEHHLKINHKRLLVSHKRLSVN